MASENSHQTSRPPPSIASPTSSTSVVATSAASPISSTSVVATPARPTRYRHAQPSDPNAQHPVYETMIDFLRASEQVTARRVTPEARAAHTRQNESSLARQRDEAHSSNGLQGRKRTASGTETTILSRTSNNNRTPPSGSAARPIDLTGSSPQRPLPQLPPAASRRGSNVVLPKWQPDANVDRCPVCRTTFSFWYRKHHCRKCGRVVCANCSPHRITIPRQYIVHPPPGTSSPIAVLSGIAGLSDDRDDFDSRYSPTRNPSSRDARARTQEDLESDATYRANMALGGGLTVRVCNPCVPDPNFSPPPQSPGVEYPTTAHMDLQRYSVPNDRQRSGGLSRRATVHSSQHLEQPLPGPRTSSDRPSLHASSNSLSRSRTTPTPHSRDGERFTPRDRRSSPATSSVEPARPVPHYASRSSAGPSNSSSSSRSLPQPGTASTLHRRAMSALAGQRPDPPVSHHSSSRPPVIAATARPQIAEEDECPVCGRELPARGAGGDESARSAHVQDCIRRYSSSVPVSRTPEEMSAFEASRVTNSREAAVVARAGSSGEARAVPPASPSSPQRQHRRAAGNRMLVYHATEKDCTTAEGTSQECVICFEEFEEGDEMGRLECLCKFHRACIRQWWDTKGAGSCPTHQLQL